MGAPKGHPKWGGRPKGGANKVTTEARAAIAMFVDNNAHRLQEWLDKIANGQLEVDSKGKEIKGSFAVQPDPVKAFELFQSVIEYHVPKLQRTELTGKDGDKVHYVVQMPAPVDGIDEWLKNSK